MKNLYFFLALSILFVACEKDESIFIDPSKRYNNLLQEMLNLEYSIYNEDVDGAIFYTNNIDKNLTKSYNLFCPEESSRIDAARLVNHILAKNIEQGQTQSAWNDFRGLKALIMNMKTEANHDPYLGLLWLFEEEMFVATSIAIDPMLKLYEYNEFEGIVNCMNTLWISVKTHQPSIDLVDGDYTRYKNQAIYKIYLGQVIDSFFVAVDSADWEDMPLCESAEHVREAYKNYIFSLISDIDNYKADFVLSSHFNVRLSEDNYQALKKLKATDLKMVHLVNLAISKIVNSKEYNKYIKG